MREFWAESSPAERALFMRAVIAFHNGRRDIAYRYLGWLEAMICMAESPGAA